MGFAELPVGQVPAKVVLDGDLGGRVTGEAWSSEELKGKVHILFYVDPDESDLNEHVTEALKKADFSKDKFASVAIINMAATWLPNAAINMKLKSKQEDFPDTTYVKDMEKIIVKKWYLDDDNSDIVVFDKNGKVLFSRDGKLSNNQVQQLLKIIRDNL